MPAPAYQDHQPQGTPQGTLVCVPGVNSGAYLMQGAVPVMGEGWRVVAANPPGTGGVPLNLPLTAKSYAQQVWDTINGMGVTGPIVLMGHSLGGFAAQEMARMRPQKVQRLILVSTSRGQPDTAADMAHMAKQVGINFWEMQHVNLRHPIQSQKVLFGKGFTDRQPQTFNWFIQQRDAHLPGHAATLAQLSAGGSFSSAPWVYDIKTPTLVIHGTDDLMVSLKSGHKLADALPNATWLALHGVGHFPMLEHPSFWNYVSAFARGGTLGEGTQPGLPWWQRLWHKLNLHG